VKHPRRILAIDVGGTGLKLAIVDLKGKLLSEHLRVPTPHPSTPAALIKTLVPLAGSLGAFDCISIGFPGVVRGTHVLTAPNLGTELWAGYDLAGTLSRKLGGKPARIANDADIQGLAIVKGKGLEFVMTLGTGIGTSLFRDGELMPHMELAHMPAADGKDFDGYIGDKVLKKIGRKRWNKRVAKMLPYFFTLLHYDHLYLGGGNAHKLTIELPPKSSTVSNIAGLKGGAALWRKHD